MEGQSPVDPSGVKGLLGTGIESDSATSGNLFAKSVVVGRGGGGRRAEAEEEELSRSLSLSLSLSPVACAALELFLIALFWLSLRFALCL